MKKMKKFICLIFPFLLTFLNVFAQQTGDALAVSRETALNIFLDGADGDLDYIRENFTIVNYVNNYQDADVHLLVTYLSTGSGGTAFNIILSGLGRYKSLIDTLMFSLSPDATDEETRSALLNKIKLGLVPYLLKTPYGDKISLKINDNGPVTPDESDPWKSWVFDISGTGSFSRQKTSQSLNLSGNLYLSKVTPGIKIESSNSFGYFESKFRLYDRDSLIYAFNTSQKDFSSRNIIVKSFGNHFGLGGFAAFGKSEYSNLDFQMIIGPAVEFNLFSYEEASTRQCRILYSLNYEHTNYKTITIYNKMNDYLFRHDLSINFLYYNRWGTLSAYALGSAYADNISQYSMEASAAAYIRLFKGLSFNISGGFAYCNNQRSLRQEPFDPEDLWKGREMEQDFSYSVRIGLSYRFGSKNNNTVNPRFGN